LVTKVKKWLIRNSSFIFIISIIILANVLWYAFPRPPYDGKIEGAIQNHLVWSVSNECYFVKPLNTTDVLLVRLPDCDKAETKGR